MRVQDNRPPRPSSPVLPGTRFQRHQQLLQKRGNPVVLYYRQCADGVNKPDVVRQAHDVLELERLK